MRVLVTGAAGFIGFYVSKRLLERGDKVIGIDNLNDYYDVSLKEARLEELRPHQAFSFVRLDLADKAAIEGLFEGKHFDRVVHLAAQAGVRYSLENPHAYIQSNIVGFMNVLECCRQQWSTGRGPANHHLIFASSSSVYGLNTKMPFSIHSNVDHPISLYGATKKANELMAHAYSNLYGIPTTGLRFFTVYGPWGRPDMALFKFTRAILSGEPIDVYNHGDMSRDFTYIDDIVEGVVRVVDTPPQPNPRWNGLSPDPGTSIAPYKLYNIGNHHPVNLMEFIHTLEAALGKKARMNLMPMQKGDVRATYADVDDLMRDVRFAPHTRLEDGISAFVDWYRSYYRV